MANFTRSQTFNPGTLGYHLATFEEDVNRAVNQHLEEAAARAEASMVANAPWTDDTGDARRGLWAHGDGRGNIKKILMGHGVEYGIYLEKSNDGRFQIVIPTLLETGRAFMRSCEHLFAQMQTHTTAAVGAVAPGTGIRQGTSQGIKERMFGAQTRPSLILRDERGRFADQGKGYSKAAIAAKAAAKVAETKRVARNTAARARYAARKAAGTLPTRRTKRG